MFVQFCWLWVLFVCRPSVLLVLHTFGQLCPKSDRAENTGVCRQGLVCLFGWFFFFFCCFFLGGGVFFVVVCFVFLSYPTASFNQGVCRLAALTQGNTALCWTVQQPSAEQIVPASCHIVTKVERQLLAISHDEG